MFKKYYKAANDDIKTNRELIDKIFETAEKPSKTVKFAKVYKIGAAVAAVFVFAAGAFLYPQIAKLNEKPILPSETVQVAEDKNQELVVEKGEELIETQDETFSPNEQQKKSDVTENDADKGITTDSVNQETDAVVDTEDSQPFSVRERAFNGTVEESSDIDTSEILFDSFKEVSEEEAEGVQNFLKSTFGEKDEATGNAFIFEIVGKAEGMYLGRWKWWVVDHSSLLCEFVLNEELTEMYDCIYTENNSVQWNTQNNLLNN